MTSVSGKKTTSVAVTSYKTSYFRFYFKVISQQKIVNSIICINKQENIYMYIILDINFFQVQYTANKLCNKLHL